MRNVPYINLPKQHEEIKKELLAEISQIFDSADFVMGAKVAEFEQAIAKYCGTKFAVGVNSGTDALFLTLKAYGIGQGDEVITAPNSFLATVSAIIATGATPVFVDVRDDLNIDPTKIEAVITPKTKAIMPVHLTGRCSDMTAIMGLAKKHNLKVVEDAAQAIGAEYHGKKAGALGDAGCFSLHPLKTLNACGDGGFITTDDEALSEKLLQLRNIGLKNRDESDFWGYNSRLDSFQAAIALVKLKYLDDWVNQRRQNAKFYFENLAEIVKTPKADPGQAFHTYVIQAEKRDELQKFLQDNGIETKVHYPIPIHLQKAAAFLKHKKGAFPVVEKQAEQILSLPIYQGLAKADLEYVVSKIKEFLGG